MEQELKRFLLTYLLAYHFESRADMARKLGLDKRHMLRILNGTEKVKDSNSVFGRALEYCLQNNISLERIALDFFARLDAQAQAESGMDDFARLEICPAYHAREKIPTSLDGDGTEALLLMLSALEDTSSPACAKCKSRPGQYKRNEETCFLARVASTVCEQMEHLYSQT